MDKDTIWEWLKNDPDSFFELLESHNINLKELSELDLPKLFIKERYKEGFTQEEFEAGEAVLWLAYFAEREISEDILFIETQTGKVADEVRTMLDEMNFGQKIKFIDENYNHHAVDPFH